MCGEEFESLICVTDHPDTHDGYYCDICNPYTTNADVVEDYHYIMRENAKKWQKICTTLLVSIKTM